MKSQADSLNNKRIELKIVSIIGKGVWGYLKNIPQLRKQIMAFNPDIIHSHYFFCGIIAALASRKIPIVVSLMGSDTHQSKIMKLIIKLFSDYKWTKTLVKSEDMKIRLGLINAVVLSNGVDLNLFHPLDKKECRQKLGWDLDNKYVLFASNPDRKEKNFGLAQATIDKIKINFVELKIIYNIDHSQMPVYLNAADVLLLTSKWEGSPNIVKEAMSCNLPVVATKVGDIEYLFGNTEGYYYTDPDPDKLAEKINYVLNNDIKPNGRQRIIDLKLDSESIADKLIQLYQEVIQS
ncbi:MAG: putative teichuronic acid biosynthesis glycosyltransferase TuaC [Bacteroidetes bacterium ADurb.Bin035]|nr:MAG: putative teichuronic acid biosynthesis glycosyltransferase TuaC [Bacteroidetes bacterium ADurb.Bin035]